MKQKHDAYVLTDKFLDGRKRIIDLTYKMGHVGSHTAPSLSCVDILTVLFSDYMDFDKDLFVLSKGHGGLGYYVALYEAGVITEDQLNTFEDNGGLFPGQPSKCVENTVIYSGGSLGLGLCYAVGRAMLHDGEIYTLLGDGELNEGTNWESAMYAGFHKIKNLTAIVDYNKMQSDGASDKILEVNIAGMFKAAGWDIIECDGHDAEDICKALDNERKGPTVIIAHTVKGKGISFMENNPEWHHNHLDDKLYADAKAELEK